MKSLLHRSAVAALILLLCPRAPSLAPLSERAPQAASTRTALSDPGTEKKIEELLRKMTLEEKVGQLVQYSAGQPTGPGTGRTDYEDMIRKGEVGALFNITTARQVNAFQHLAVEQSRLHIPLLFGLDVIHGFKTEFPVPLALASSWNLELVEQSARVAAREASASGIRWTFSPMVDIARDARWGRMAEGSGEDPYLGMAVDIKEPAWMRPTASLHAQSISLATAQPKAVATITRQKFQSTPCANSICLLFMQPSTRVPPRS